MHVEKEARAVSIFLRDGACIKGKIHINPGERIIDFLNDPKEAFIVVTDTEFCGHHGRVRSFRIYDENRTASGSKAIFLLKNAVKFAVEI